MTETLALIVSYTVSWAPQFAAGMNTEELPQQQENILTLPCLVAEFLIEN